ncbi:hypothetical protein [Actinoallomurus rhizosphaericola]|uniref:hypothetical protein n=1 Tax=Actinoallomurus rhizosphaericola TaxID=2952536 RepID=UPI002090BEF0|nr:hypothetical protein [Actinoallomurus rhizosphaericola]MCO5994273.1 hypothetical protein [Actinoallomurus rhizosphaericola]
MRKHRRGRPRPPRPWPGRRGVKGLGGDEQAHALALSGTVYLARVGAAKTVATIGGDGDLSVAMTATYEMTRA